MGYLLDRRKFLQHSLTFCSGLVGFISIPSMVWGRITSIHNETPVAFSGVLAAPVVRVVGVGGAGCNAVNSMIAAGIRGVEYVAVDTDVLGLSKSLAANRILIGFGSTKGGAGSDAQPEIGYENGYLAAKEHSEALRMAIQGADLLFIVAGLGGDTGTGAAPVIASIAKKLGILTIGAMTTPYLFEGERRRRQARAGLRAIGGILDSTIVVNHQELSAAVDRKTTLHDSFRISDEVSRQAVAALSNLIAVPGVAQADFRDVRTVARKMRSARVGQGIGLSGNRAMAAAQRAINSPLLGAAAIENAAGVILNISGGPGGLNIQEACDVARYIEQMAGRNAQVVWGITPIAEQTGKVVITIIAGR